MLFCNDLMKIGLVVTRSANQSLQNPLGPALTYTGVLRVRMSSSYWRWKTNTLRNWSCRSVLWGSGFGLWGASNKLSDHLHSILPHYWHITTWKFSLAFFPSIITPLKSVYRAFHIDDHLTVFEQLQRIFSIPYKLGMIYTVSLDFREIVTQCD